MFYVLWVCIGHLVDRSNSITVCHVVDFWIMMVVLFCFLLKTNNLKLLFIQYL